MADGEVGAHPRFPQHGEFYRRVLDHVPTPIIVLDDHARVVYANLAAQDIGGWTPDDGVGLDTFDQIHPDDLGWAAEVFANVLEQSRDGPELEHSRAGGVHFRMLTAAGEEVPLHVTAASGVADPYVQGIIYDLRPDWGPNLMSRILAGVAHGESVDVLLERVVALIAVPPVPVDVAIVDRADPVDPHVVAVLDDAFAPGALALPLLVAPDGEATAAVATVDQLDGRTRAALEADGYDMVWHAPIRVPGSDLDYHIVAGCRSGRRYTMTVHERMRRAADLASVVLLRAENDARVLHAATHDALTLLPNRPAFYDHVETRSAAGQRLVLLYIDLDDFKPVNDRYGHATGDAVLRQIADRLGRATRPNDLAARLGGDEFAVCLSGPVTETEIHELAERVRAAIAEPIAAGDLGVAEDLTVTASIGIATSDGGTHVEALLAAADAAMYDAKRRAGPPTR